MRTALFVISVIPGIIGLLLEDSISPATKWWSGILKFFGALVVFFYLAFIMAKLGLF